MNKSNKTPKVTGKSVSKIVNRHVTSTSNLPPPPRNGESTPNGTEECEKVHRHVTPTSILPPPPKKK